MAGVNISDAVLPPDPIVSTNGLPVLDKIALYKSN